MKREASGRETAYGQSSAFNRSSERSSERPFDRSESQFSGRGPKGYRRSDDRVKEEVCETLSLSPRVDATEIEVDVKDVNVQKLITSLTTSLTLIKTHNPTLEEAYLNLIDDTVHEDTRTDEVVEVSS